jgi:hypothetical protein
MVCSSLVFNTVVPIQFCRSDTLEGKARNEDKTRRWKEDDSYVLICKCVSCAVDFVLAYHQVHRIASLDVDDENDIDWKSLSDPAWNMWSGHFLQQKWRQLKTSCNADGIIRHRGGYMTSIMFSFPASRS